MRATIATDLARLCAERAADDVKADLLSVARKMKEASSDEDLFRLDVQFWERLADGAGNIAYRLALNTMLRSTQAKGALAVQWSAYEVRANAFRLPVATAIASGDGARAEATTREAMRAGVELFAASIGRARLRREAEKRPPAKRPRAKAART